MFRIRSHKAKMKFSRHLGQWGKGWEERSQVPGVKVIRLEGH